MSTIFKVAERAGVSPTTVSHVINHADRVSEHLRARVQKAIEELGYRPNAQAKSLRTGRTNVIALLIPDILNLFYTELVKTAQVVLNRTGRDILVFNADVPGGNAQAHSREYLAQMRSKGVDGMIIGDFALHGMYEAVSEIRLPAVFVGHLPEGEIDNVKADDYGGGLQMGRYLAAQGYRRIAQITGPADFPSATLRRDGFIRGLREGGVAEADHQIYVGNALAPAGMEGVRQLLCERPGDPPRALFVANVQMTLGAMAGLSDAGLRIPDDVALAVYGNHAPMEYLRPTLTHIGVQPATLAERACELLLDRLDGRYNGLPRREVIDCAFQAGRSA